MRFRVVTFLFHNTMVSVVKVACITSDMRLLLPRSPTLVELEL